MPCYNPAPGWAYHLLSNFQNLQACYPDLALHLILVNDGSTRGILPTDVAFLQDHLRHFTYLHHEANQGKGFAVRRGVQASENPLCLYTDIDFPYTLESMAKIINGLMQAEADILAGVRETEYYAQVPPIRIKISQALQLLTKHLLHLPINDTQCGLKGFNQKGKQVFLKTKTNRYLFDLEFIYLLSKAPSRPSIQPVTVELKPEVTFSRMDAKILFQESFSFLKILFRSSVD
ncbi:glycosyltransferase [Rufibacter glacialis]|uniref:Glycosyltransferase n=1 Tax=Rufibacter glacialis TaxID=1259555 RepID=A0ABV4RD34_9BACT|nr:glycosyltransferase [Rufibacter glacialis]